MTARYGAAKSEEEGHLAILPGNPSGCTLISPFRGLVIGANHNVWREGLDAEGDEMGVVA